MMLRKFVSLLLVVIMSIGCALNVFAASNAESEYQIITVDGIEKAIFNIGGNKLICWDDGDNTITEQYDMSGNFVCRSVGNRVTGDIVTTNSQNTVQTINVNEMGSLSTSELPSTKGIGSYTSVGKVGASNAFTQERKQMKVYESLSGKKITTYTVENYNGTVASFVSGVALSLGISAMGAGVVVGALVGAALAIIVDTIITITSSVTLAATRYSTSYYGQDTSSGKSSLKITNSGYRFTIIETDSKFEDQNFFEGAYYDPNNFDESLPLLDRLVDNLYGVDFSPYEI